MPFQRILNAGFRSGLSRLNNSVGERIGNIDNPLLRGGLQNLLDTAIPGLGGGTPDLRNNAFDNLIQRRLQISFAEFEQEIASFPGVQQSQELSESYDWRARLRPKDGGVDKFYSRMGLGEGDQALLDPISNSGGLVWPTTPQVFLQTSVEYDQKQMQGMNYPINTYQQGGPREITITGTFTANDIHEAQYLLATLTFLRAATKSYFGDAALANGDYGTPPPVMLFEYLGDHGFNKVPVVITSWNMDLSPDIHYVPATVNDTVTYVPTQSNIAITLLPTYTPHKVRRKYDLDAIKSGAAYRDGFI